MKEKIKNLLADIKKNKYNTDGGCSKLDCNIVNLPYFINKELSIGSIQDIMAILGFLIQNEYVKIEPNIGLKINTEESPKGEAIRSAIKEITET